MTDTPVKPRKGLGGAARQTNKPKTQANAKSVIDVQARVLNAATENAGLTSELNNQYRYKPSDENIQLKDVVKVRNPRDIPCTLAEFATIRWPALVDDNGQPVSVYDARALLLELVRNEAWFVAEEEQAILDFLCDIHVLAQSTSQLQLQQVVVWKDLNQPGRYQLVLGERRVLSKLYAGQRTIRAMVLNKQPSEEDIIKWSVDENLRRVGLKLHEELNAYFWQFNGVIHEGKGEPSVRQFEAITGLKRDKASHYLKIYKSGKLDEIIKLLKSRELKTLADVIQFLEPDKLNKKPGKAKAKTVSGNRTAKDYGLVVNRKTQTTGLQKILLHVVGSDLVSDEISDAVSSLDLSKPSQLKKAFTSICQHLDVEEQEVME